MGKKKTETKKNTIGRKGEIERRNKRKMERRERGEEATGN